MENIIYYLVEYGIYLLCFYVLYALLFKGKSDHKFNRFYLLSSNLICLILPLFKNASYLSAPEIFSVVLNPIEIVAEGTTAIINEASQSMPITTILALTYLVITAVFLARFIYSLLKINSFKINSEVSNYDNYSVIESDQISTPFSFFNSIYLPKGDYAPEEKSFILEHELSHIRFGHSFEKLFLLLNKVFFWWNPISYKYFTELELIHEYQVDEQLCTQSSKKYYGEFLLSQLNIQSQYSFVNNISSHIKNRIIMISSQRKNTPTFIKWSAYLTMFIAVMFLHSCSTEIDEPLIQDNYEAKVNIDHSDSYTAERVDTVIIFDYDTQKETVKIMKTEYEVYKKPEVMPVFGNCASFGDVDAKYECSNNNLLKFIYTNLIYPTEAKDANIEGMTVVRFVIDKKGEISSKEIVRSIHPSTDKAVLTVLDKMSSSDTKWTAGRQAGEDIATQFTLPVKFKLE